LIYLHNFQATHSNSKYPIDNLYAPIYIGDPNVTEGKQFRIICRSEKPIKWFKDGEPIENHFIRHRNEDEFSYIIRDNESEDSNGKVDSTLTVTRAVLRHKGRYQCNINHKNSHFLNVHPSAQTSDNSEEQEDTFATFESENDHEDQRERFDIPIEMTTVESFVEKVPMSTFLPNRAESIPSFEDEKSHENFAEETTYEDSSDTSYIPSTILISTLPSFTKPLIHSTHATTHSTSEVVLTQTHHLEKHHSKGSQNEK
jgi:hypothetical protein